MKSILLSFLLIAGIGYASLQSVEKEKDKIEESFPVDLDDLLRGQPQIFVSINENVPRRRVKTKVRIHIKGSIRYFRASHAVLGFCVDGDCETMGIPIGMLRYYTVVIPPFENLSIERSSVPLAIAVFRPSGFNPLTGKLLPEKKPVAEYKRLLKIPFETAHMNQSAHSEEIHTCL